MALTLKQLIDSFRSDLDSPFQKLRYQVRIKQGRTFDRISEKYGHHQLRGIKGPTLLYWYKVSGSGGRTAAANELIARLRVLFKFGSTLLEDPECKRLAELLRERRFSTQGPRFVQLTAEHVHAICRTAREHFGWYSIALAQAFQFELGLGQKDVIGEWVPIDEPGSSDVENHGRKWLRGLRWSDIDRNLILRHSIGSSGRSIQVDLKKAPMVLAEIKAIGLDVAALPSSDPIIINDVTGLPWSTTEFRRKWRLVAKQAGVPDVVKNRDSVPTGTIVGGPNQAPVLQRITLARIGQSLRSGRR